MTSRAPAAVWLEIQKLVQEIDSTKNYSLVESGLKQLFNNLRSEDLLSLRIGELALSVARGKASPSNSIGTATLLYGHNTELTVFALPPGTRLPLHDHPKMHVLNKVVFGTLHEFSGDWTNTDEGPSCKSLKCVACGTADETAPVKYVTPREGGVLHEFWTSQQKQQQQEDGCVFVDFFSPRYNSAPDYPTCSYYSLPELKSKSLQSTVDDEEDKVKLVGRVFECVKIPDPEIAMHSIV